MTKPKLVSPSIKYKKSYLEAFREFKAKPAHWDGVIDDPGKDFGAFVKGLLDRSRGKNLPKGWVPDSTLWLVWGNKYLGRVSIRHKLTPALRVRGGHIGYAVRPSERGKGYGTLLMKGGLKKAKALGIKKALITCYYRNIPSKTIIEHAGGKLFARTTVNGEKTLKYLVTT